MNHTCLYFPAAEHHRTLLTAVLLISRPAEVRRLSWRAKRIPICLHLPSARLALDAHGGMSVVGLYSPMKQVRRNCHKATRRDAVDLYIVTCETAAEYVIITATRRHSSRTCLRVRRSEAALTSTKLFYVRLYEMSCKACVNTNGTE